MTSTWTSSVACLQKLPSDTSAATPCGNNIAIIAMSSFGDALKNTSPNLCGSRRQQSNITRKAFPPSCQAFSRQKSGVIRRTNSSTSTHVNARVVFLEPAISQRITWRATTFASGSIGFKSFALSSDNCCVASHTSFSTWARSDVDNAGVIENHCSNSDSCGTCGKRRIINNGRLLATCIVVIVAIVVNGSFSQAPAWSNERPKDNAVLHE
mmetsp:Transcript_86375/g.241591  ORF Transcript_86375/g.241591 Transcript_86375/m.241591 type:complete len:211 (-) Transcript_86375:35-667(-)